MPDSEPTGEAPGVNVSGQGTQVGSGNTQYNNWGQRPPLDPVALGVLNPHTAVARLQRESHDDLVDFFARATPGDVGEILQVFLEMDEDKAVAVLGDIGRRKSHELISAARPKALGVVFLITLPDAALEIARKATSLKWTDAGHLEYFGLGYFRKFNGGRIFWAAGHGVYVTVGQMDAYWTEHRSTLGLPVEDQRTVESWSGAEGVRQKFLAGTVYSSNYGIFRVIGDGCHEDEGGSNGWLGLPTGEFESNHTFGSRQGFEGGVIYSYLKNEFMAFAVRREVIDAVPSPGWRPVSKESQVISSFGTRGIVQCLEFHGTGRTHESAVYSIEKYRTVTVAFEVWPYYNEIGAEKSWLGFPVREAKFEPLPNSRIQEFEGGEIYQRLGREPIAVSGEVASLVRRTSRDGLVLGCPVTAELPVGEDGSGRIQYFERGVVTLRNGKREIWRRS
jgi:uncharacterized protein with LGFP repeats